MPGSWSFLSKSMAARTPGELAPWTNRSSLVVLLAGLALLAVLCGILTAQGLTGRWLLWFSIPLGVFSILFLFAMAFIIDHNRKGAARMTFLSSILLQFVPLLFAPPPASGESTATNKSAIRAEILFEPDAEGNPQALPPGKTRIDLKEVDIADRTVYLEDGKSDFSFRDVPASFQQLRFEIRFEGYHATQRTVKRPLDTTHPAQITMRQNELKPLATRTVSGTVSFDGAPWTTGGTVISRSALWECAHIGEGDTSGGFFTLRRVSITSDEFQFVITLRKGPDKQVYRKTVKLPKLPSPDADIPVTLDLLPGDLVGQVKDVVENLLRGTWNGNLSLNARQVFLFSLQSDSSKGSNIEGRIRHGSTDLTCDTAFLAEQCTYDKSSTSDKAKWEHAGYVVDESGQTLVKIRVGKRLAGKASPKLNGVLYLVVKGNTAVGQFPDSLSHARVSLSRTGS